MERTYTQRELDIEVKNAITQVLSHFSAEFTGLANEAFSKVMANSKLTDGYQQLGMQKAFNKATLMIQEKELEVLKSDLR